MTEIGLAEGTAFSEVACLVDEKDDETVEMKAV